MGVPKFFKWISERYPMISQVISSDQIPEFDNFYLDMNGIIHKCSHPDDGALSHLSENEIFDGIFSYIEHLYQIIRPKKIFFLALDGVAPRAKMNQQRARRFRTAQERLENIKKARKKGEPEPKEPPFDSNCITPGTLFMSKLTIHLEYFLNKKITQDPTWRNIDIILSGHEVPGEGEHKIMEFIRAFKSSSCYIPNTRHCIYGLDADLIMLALVSHEPHFSLLREQVTFGKSKFKETSPFPTFDLLHLTLLREYLALEFSFDDPPFNLDQERFIDDFILLMVFIGNDFVPHLPSLHIHTNALNVLIDAYKSILPKISGYLNDSGQISLDRLQLFFEELSKFELNVYTESLVSPKDEHKPVIQQKPKIFAKDYSKEELQEKLDSGLLYILNHQDKYIIACTPLVNQIYDTIYAFSIQHELDQVEIQQVSCTKLDKEILLFLAYEMNINVKFGKNSILFHMDDILEPDSSSSSEDEETLNRAMEKYEGHITEQDTELLNDFNNWKRIYYKSKLQYDPILSPDSLRKHVLEYIDIIQWIMLYYYQGVPSWSFYYAYHYAPKISDLNHIDNHKCLYTIDRPFLPFEQLLAVLPPASSDLVPIPFRELMEIDSPIGEFYPVHFDIDLNGKKNDWEAVVHIPFIKEDLLVNAMQSKIHLLNKEEKNRNQFGSTLAFSYNQDLRNEALFYKAPTTFFQDIRNCTAEIRVYDLPIVKLEGVFKPIHGDKVGIDMLHGFPTLSTLPFIHQLKCCGVSIFKGTFPSTNVSMMLYVLSRDGYSVMNEEYDDSSDNENEVKDVDTFISLDIASRVLGQIAMIDWPFRHEALVYAISDANRLYQLSEFPTRKDYPDIQISKSSIFYDKSNNDIIQRGLSDQEKSERMEYLERLKTNLKSRCAVRFGSFTILIHIIRYFGMKEMPDGSLVKQYDKIPNGLFSSVCPIQLCFFPVLENHPEMIRYQERPKLSLSELFPIGSVALLEANGGNHAKIVSIISHNEKIQVKEYKAISLDITKRLPPAFAIDAYKHEDMISSSEISGLLQLSPLLLSRLASIFYLYSIQDTNLRVNIGLGLKFDKQGFKILNWSEKHPSGYWMFNRKLIDILKEYKKKFPNVITRLESLTRKNLTKIYITDVFHSTTSIARSKPGETAHHGSTLSVKGKEEMSKLTTWIEELSFEKLERVSIDDFLMSKGLVRRLENYLAITNKEDLVSTSNSIQNVTHEQLISPVRKSKLITEQGMNINTVNSSLEYLQTESFSLGDRIIFVIDHNLLHDPNQLPPLGTLGTVIGLKDHDRILTILLDRSWVNATSLNGLCSDERGLIVPFYVVTKLHFEKKHEKPAIVPQARKTTSNAWKVDTSDVSIGKYSNVPPPDDINMINRSKKKSAKKDSQDTEDLSKKLLSLLKTNTDDKKETHAFVPNQARITKKKI